MSGSLVLIPAFNEGKRIARVIRGVRGEVPSIEIVVIDDGSRDETRKEAAEAGATVISHPFNLGYGIALQTGYKHALKKGYDWIVQMDGDGQHDPGYIPVLLEAVRKEGADFAIGSRFLQAGAADRDSRPYQATLLKRFGMGLFGTIASILIKQKVTDPTSGYQAMNRRVLEWVSSDRFPWDYPDADVIIMLHRAGFRILEVPVRMYENREKTPMHSGWKPIYYVFKMLLSIFVTLLRK
jgi:hypothetical protein